MTALLRIVCVPLGREAILRGGPGSVGALLSYLFPDRPSAPRQSSDPFPMHNRPRSSRSEQMAADRITRHLRHERGLRLAVGRSHIPKGWAPHPTTLRAILDGVPPPPTAYGDWTMAYAAWQVALRVSCTCVHQPLEHRLSIVRQPHTNPSLQ